MLNKKQMKILEDILIFWTISVLLIAIIPKVQAKEKDFIKEIKIAEINSGKIMNEVSKTEQEQVFNVKEQQEVDKEEVESTFQDEPSYTTRELDLLSRVMNGEAGSNWLSIDHPLAVGNVVLNRVKSSLYPDTIEGVIYDEGQYACSWDGNMEKEVPQHIIDDAKKLLEGYRMMPDNVIYQAPSRQGKGVWKKIDNHYFCY